jgi:hypothetical protein
MAQDSSELISHGPWTLGVDNLKTDQALPREALRNALNVDITREGHARRRPGFTSRHGVKSHSIWSPDGSTLYGVTNDNLSYYTRAANGTLTPTTLRAGFPSTQPVAFIAVGDKIYYSNGVVTGMIVNRVHYPWGTESVNGQPTVAASAAGGLHAGRYQVAITFVSSLGEEGGASPAVAIDVAEGGGISLSAIPQPQDASVTRIRVYRTQANADVFYLYQEYATGTTSASIGTSNSLGKVLDTWFMQPPLPGTLLEEYNGRIYIAAGSVLWFTEALRYGAILMTNFMMFPADITLLAGVDTGLIVGADQTYFLQGQDPKQMVLLPRLPHGAVKGTLVRDTRTQTLAWFSPQGLCQSDSQGNLTNVSARSVTFERAEQGAALLREANGIRQVVGALRGGVTSTLAVGDFFDAEVIRKTA